MNPIDELAQIIRTVDGKHDLSAAALAERLIEAGVLAPSAQSVLRDLLKQAVRDYDIGAWRHSARGGDDYPEREWVTQARTVILSGVEESA